MGKSSKIGNGNWEMKILESTYDSLVNIYEVEEEISEYGEYRGRRKALIHENVPCSLSADRSRTAGKSASYINSNKAYENGYMETEESYILFISPEVEIRTNSYFEITSFYGVRKFEAAGKPIIYASHQEISLYEKEEV